MEGGGDAVEGGLGIGYDWGHGWGWGGVAGVVGGGGSGERWGAAAAVGLRLVCAVRVLIHVVVCAPACAVAPPSLAFSSLALFAPSRPRSCPPSFAPSVPSFMSPSVPPLVPWPHPRLRSRLRPRSRRHAFPVGPLAQGVVCG